MFRQDDALRTGKGGFRIAMQQGKIEDREKAGVGKTAIDIEALLVLGQEEVNTLEPDGVLDVGIILFTSIGEIRTAEYAALAS